MREMKDSGIEWIGEIPKDWSLGRIKYYSEVTLGKMLQNESKGKFDTNEYYLCAANIGNFTLNLNSIKKMWFSKAEKNKLNLSKGDLLVIEGGDVGSCVYLEKDLPNIYFQNSINRIKSNYKLDIRLIKYILFLAKKVGYIDLICNKATISHLTKEKLEEIFCIVPENEEQQQIANYLDTKCSEIDATAEDIQKEISLLEDYKKSVITEAVTKGLNHDAEMKDSGIEWIGEIPKHWKIIKGKYVLEYLQKPVKDDDGVITCFRDGEVTLRSNRREDGFTLSDKEIGYQGIDVGDLVVHGMDGFAGAIGISDSRGKASPVLNVLNSKYNKRYLMYYLRSMAFSNIFVALASGIRVRSCDLRWNKLAELPYPTTNYAEQTEIVNYIDTKCSEIDTLIADKKRQLDILADYKKSLIYEYVTGKKEVPVNE